MLYIYMYIYYLTIITYQLLLLMIHMRVMGSFYTTRTQLTNIYMDLTIITPLGKILDFVIEDWEALNEQKELTEIALRMTEDSHAKMLQHTLEYSGITTRMSKDGCVIINKPKKMTISEGIVLLYFNK